MFFSFTHTLFSNTVCSGENLLAICCSHSSFGKLSYNKIKINKWINVATDVRKYSHFYNVLCFCDLLFAVHQSSCSYVFADSCHVIYIILYEYRLYISVMIIWTSGYTLIMCHDNVVCKISSCNELNNWQIQWWSFIHNYNDTLTYYYNWLTWSRTL